MVRYLLLFLSAMVVFIGLTLCFRAGAGVEVLSAIALIVVILWLWRTRNQGASRWNHESFMRLSLAVAVICTVYWFYALFSSNLYSHNGSPGNFLYIFPFTLSWTNSLVYTKLLLHTVGTGMMLAWIAWGVLYVRRER